MFRAIKNLKVSQKLGIMMSFFVLGFLIFGTYCYFSFSQVKVNGPIYNNIVQGKDLIADILPPPEYIIESYLLVLQMINETDKVSLENLYNRSKALKSDYETRHQVWVNALQPGKLKSILIEESYNPAVDFFNIRDKQFIPLIKAGDQKKAEKLAYGIMKQKYEQHRLKIDEVVKLSTKMNQDLENMASNTVVSIIFGMIMFGLLITLLTFTLWIVILRSFKPLHNVTSILKDISEGEGDLTRRIEIDSQDEIGDMAKYFNMFIDKLQYMVKNISSTTLLLSDSSKNLLHISTDMEASSEITKEKSLSVRKSVGDITKSISGAADATTDTSDNMQVVASSVEEISATVRNLATASQKTSNGIENISDLASQISANTNNVSESSKEVSTSVSHVATAVKEIDISLSEISKNCSRSIIITSDAEKKAKDTNTIITKLDISSKNIEKIINVINNIADQTNMLALNASIEAAGAGEAGKGFAVVASEVKQLAKQTAESTDQISMQIEDMQDNMSGAVKAVETITEVIDEITIITNTIASAVTQQSATTGNILNAVVKASEKVNQITLQIGEIAQNTRNTAISISDASKGVKDIASSSSELSIAANEAAKNLDKVSNMVQEVANTSIEISDSAKEILYNVEDISTTTAQTALGAKDTNLAAKSMSEIANKINSLVKQFKIE